MKFIIEPSAAPGMIRLPLKKEMKVPSLQLWEIMVSKYFSVKIYKYQSIKTSKYWKRELFSLTS